MKVLAIDIGGTHVKILATGQTELPVMSEEECGRIVREAGQGKA